MGFACDIAPNALVFVLTSSDSTKDHQLIKQREKFTEREIVLSVQYRDDELQVAVRDTGIGMSAEQQARILRNLLRLMCQQLGGTGALVWGRQSAAWYKKWAAISAFPALKEKAAAFVLPSKRLPVSTSRWTNIANSRRLI